MVVAGFRVNARLAILGLFMEPLAGLIGVMTSLALKHVVDATARSDVAAAGRGAIAAGVVLGTAYTIASLGHPFRMRLREEAGAYFTRRIVDLTASIPGLEHHERPDYLDRIEMLKEGGSALGSTVTGLVPAIASLARLGATAVLLGRISPMLLLLPAFGVPSVLLGARAQRTLDRVREENAEPIRRRRHLFELATQAGPGKELRVFGLADRILGMHADESERLVRLEATERLRSAWLRAAGWGVFSLGYVGAIAVVVWRASRGRASVGDVFLVVNLASQVNQFVGTTVVAVQWMMRSLRTADHYLWLERYASDARAGGATGGAPDGLRDGIVLDRVTFRYPGTEADVLRDVSLRIPAGATVAIVGDNGVGKTTLVKLLCAFYRPTSGRILVDGVDLATIDPAAWRERLAGAFQDFCRFEFVARETVGVGDLPRIEHLPAIHGALRRAGATGVVEELPGGVETQLGRSFDGGVELSTGQWQKLALGRGMMREAPLLLVLDEPTASLDAPTEFALFARYADAARNRARAGGITLLVSHRFSTVRCADRILVIESGRVTEIGTHDELMTRGGTYAELFALQAASYR